MPDEKLKDNEMGTSVSQMKTADVCLRMWWFQKRCKLPQDQTTATIFGDVGHAVCERFGLADDRGLLNGLPVNIYPDGWMTMCNKYDKTKTLYTVTPTEAVLIINLINEAILQGMLIRLPGREIEKEIRCEILNVGHHKAILRGFIDVNTPRGLHDYKFLKDKKWALSAAKLRKDIQMMGYAKWRYMTGHTGSIWLNHKNFIKDFDNPAVIDREVEVTEFEVQEFFNETILPLTKIMLDLFVRYPITKIHLWREVPGAENPRKTCNFHYGKPCPYQLICTDLYTIDQYLIKYRTTVNELIEKYSKGKVMSNPNPTPQTNSLVTKIATEQAKLAAEPAVPAAIPAAATAVAQTGADIVAMVTGNNVCPTASQATEALNAANVPVLPAAVPMPMASGGVVDSSKAIQKAPAIPAAISPPPPIMTPVAAIPAVPAVPAAIPAVPATVTIGVDLARPGGDISVTAAGQQVVPWYQEFEPGKPCPGCKDSKTLGWNHGIGRGCQVCDIMAKKRGFPGVDDYIVTANADGSMSFMLKGSTEVTTIAPVPPVAATTEIAPAVVPAVPVVPVVPVAPVVVPVVIPEGSAGAEVAESIQAHARDYPEDKGFTMLIGCTFAKGDYANVIHADMMLKDMLNNIATENRVANTAQMDHFTLMQQIDMHVPQIGAYLKDATIVSLMPAKGSAHERLIGGLRQYADTVIFPYGT